MRDKIVVSLSTIPPRFKYIGRTLCCLLNQKWPADEIQLFVPRSYKRFPQHSFSIPEVPNGITVKIVDQDMGPATKVLYCVREHWGTKTRIIYCDDDRIPDQYWLQSFVKASENNPDKAVVSTGWHLKRYGISTQFTRLPRAVKLNVIENYEYIGRRIKQKIKEIIFQRSFQKPSRINCKQSGYIDIAAGYGGVSIKPEFLGSNAFEIPHVVWTVDDVWLSGMMECSGIGIWQDNSIRVPVNLSDEGVAGLGGSVIEGHNRHSANKFGINYFQEKYSIWR